MRSSLVPPLIGLLLLSGCATHRNAGAALVGVGLAVAVVTASATTSHTALTPEGYSRSTSRHGAAAAAGVAAGVALAAAGSAFARETPDDGASGPHAARGPAPAAGWRLVRPSESPRDPEGEEPAP